MDENQYNDLKKRLNAFESKLSKILESLERIEKALGISKPEKEHKELPPGIIMDKP